MFKKLLALALLAIGAITLAACEPDGPTTEEILTQIQEAVDELDLPSSASSDLTLPNTGVHDVAITWSSSDTDVIANDGSVTIPTKTDGDQTVTMTATLTLEDQTLTKSFTVTVAAATEYTDAELLQQAKDALVLSVSGIISSNDPITLPDTGLNGTTITWSSSNTAVITDAGAVTRPAADAGNATVTLTATLTLNSETTTKDIDVVVADEDPAASFDSIALLIAGSTLGDIVEYEGTVSALFDGGYFLSDGTNALGVYNPSSTLDIEVGDTVYVKGSYAKYNTLFQIGDVQEESVTAQGTGVQPLTATAKTVAEINALDSSDPLIHGQLYTVQGVVTLQGSYNNIYLVDGDDEVLIYYYSLEDSLAALEEFVGIKVEITVVYYTDHGTNGVMLAFQGLEADIALAPLTDAESVAADADAASALDTVAIYDDVTLPTAGVNGTTYGIWTSDTPTLLSNTGELLGTVTEATEVTFTSTVTKNSESDDATLTVVVVPDSTIAEVLELEEDDYFLTDGIVYEEAYYGIYINDGTGPLFIYSKDLQDEVEPGDSITILGKVGFYSGLLQANIINDDYTIDDTANGTLPTAEVATVEAAETDVFPRGTIITVTARVTVEGNYNDVYLNGLDGGKVKVYYRSNADEIAGKDDDGYFGFVDQWITLDIVTYQNGTVLFQGLTADITEATMPTAEQAYVDAVLHNIDLGDLDEVEYNLDLPENGEKLTGLDITWTSSDPTFIDTEGKVLEYGYGFNKTVTLTASVTYGATTSTRDFVVTLIDGDTLGPQSVANTLLAADGEVVIVTGIVTGFNYGGHPFIQDADGGAAILIYYWNLDQEVEVGDEIVIRGQRGQRDDVESVGYSGDDVDVELLEISSSDNTIVIIDDMTAAEIGTAADYADNQLKRYTAELTFNDMDDGFGYMILDGGDVDLKIDMDDYPLFAEIFAVDDSATFTFNLYDLNFGTYRLFSVELDRTSLTDAQKLAATQFLLDIPAGATSDLTLPTTWEDLGATITWSSGTPATITDAGVVTRPASGSPDVVVTMTATISLGTETDLTKDFDVTVYAAYTAVGTELFISEVGEHGSSKAIEIFNPTDTAIDLSDYSIKINFNANTNWGSNITLEGTIGPGQTFVLIDDGTSNATLVAAADQVDNNVSFNGNDAIGLFKDDVLIDFMGVMADDTYWNDDSVLIRAATVTGPNATYTEAEWVDGTDEDYSGFGSHTVTPAS